ncbi:SNF2 DOMAIN-CONTAINING PROTEIN CLASSY 2 [Salix purpurea]|uniref:SNF2 DOMAIN-CONTAINING PROTEIN CLASSY 2 n=1 Tax=Salix purpurea TaxID=77065 RepID=A0A9Q0ZN75_SALPP|nr:SNF2 DOMAIN-CONTAINING PROTEIN CLASSY 2 [Salix purpurea]
MKNIDATIKSKEIPRVIDQWEEFKAKHSSDQKEKMEFPSVEDDGQSSETEMLWREMELCLASAYILEDNEALVSTQTTQNSDGNCQHEFKLDEEIGILCQICGFVKTEIKYVSAPFMEHTGWTAESKPQNEEDSELKPDEDEDLSVFGNHTSVKAVHVEVNDNLLEVVSREKRPTVLAPKTTLYTVQGIYQVGNPVPIHLIHGTRSSRVFKPTPAVLRGSGPRPSQDVVHILDCLEKMQKWHAQPSGTTRSAEIKVEKGFDESGSRSENIAFGMEEPMELERLRFDCKKGSKVMFVLNLVYRVVKNEKVLIFCHNIAPIKLFLELFENIFRWQQGKEVVVLTGELELFERGRVMDKFEELGGPSRVLLASITACAEGISLTAASRVILLDSEWNPSKTKQAIARAFRPGQQKMVYVYQLLATGTVEEDKYRRTAWKEWVSRMIFSEEFVEDPSRWQAEKIEDDVLREIVEEDRVKSFHMIMKNEKASTS